MSRAGGIPGVHAGEDVNGEVEIEQASEEQRLEQVRITMVRDSVFHAELIFDGDVRVSSRVSDAVALALHLDVPITAEDSVLDEVGLANAEVVDVSGVGGPASPGTTGDDLSIDPVEEIERFRKFLDEASPEDFGKS